MALSMLVFEGDRNYDKRLKEASNYSDNSHIYTGTYGVTQLILSALSPLVLDGNKKLTIKLNIENDMAGEAGYTKNLILPFSVMLQPCCWIFWKQ